MAATKPAPRRALLGEDDAQMRAVVADALRREGFDVDEVEDGARMLSHATHANGARAGAGYDLIVSDVRMPLVDGLTVVERLRAMHVRTPVILMTAFGDDSTRARAKEVGALLFDKPFKLSELRAVARVLFPEAARRGSP